MTKQELFEKCASCNYKYEEMLKYIEEYVQEYPDENLFEVLIDVSKEKLNHNRNKKLNSKYNYNVFYGLQYSFLPSFYFTSPDMLPLTPDFPVKEACHSIIKAYYKAIDKELDIDLESIDAYVIEGKPINLLIYHFDSPDFDIEPLAKYMAFPFVLEGTSVKLGPVGTFEYIDGMDDLYLACYAPNGQEKISRIPIGKLGGFKESLEHYYNALEQRD